MAKQKNFQTVGTPRSAGQPRPTSSKVEVAFCINKTSRLSWICDAADFQVFKHHLRQVYFSEAVRFRFPLLGMTKEVTKVPTFSSSDIVTLSNGRLVNPTCHILLVIFPTTLVQLLQLFGNVLWISSKINVYSVPYPPKLCLWGFNQCNSLQKFPHITSKDFSLHPNRSWHSRHDYQNFKANID